MTERKLNARELHARARDVSADRPPEFEAAVTRLEAAEREREDALWGRDDLIREARAIGISYVALARWTGLGERRLDQIVNDR
ncbi:MAG TPA: hypothetical protein VK631_08455 [Solirubrobacteraceae bacterium]|nr:hypothetical protein [Solirubrobacteraceae bacterium]